jgi:hypothetical protein
MMQAKKKRVYALNKLVFLKIFIKYPPLKVFLKYIKLLTVPNTQESFRCSA